MPVKEIICLANSRKHGHHCIAGLETNGSGWIRPIGLGSDGSLRIFEMRLQNGSSPQILDIIRIGCQKAVPKPHQPENWLIDGSRWHLAARPSPQDSVSLLLSGLKAGPSLLGNNWDRCDYDSFIEQPAIASLAAIVPDNVQWRITTGRRGNRQTRANFSLSGMFYDLSITDPHWEQRLRPLTEGIHNAKSNGISSHDVPVFIISLGEPFAPDIQTSFCYKLIAGIILLKRENNNTVWG